MPIHALAAVSRGPMGIVSQAVGTPVHGSSWPPTHSTRPPKPQTAATPSGFDQAPPATHLHNWPYAPVQWARHLALGLIQGQLAPDTSTASSGAGRGWDH